MNDDTTTMDANEHNYSNCEVGQNGGAHTHTHEDAANGGIICPCLTCKKETEDTKAIECGQCNNWYHISSARGCKM